MNKSNLNWHSDYVYTELFTPPNLPLFRLLIILKTIFNENSAFFYCSIVLGINKVHIADYFELGPTTQVNVALL